uniref:Uncharacterized protein n=1 Tax=Anguilla anguilla TaxID=7936 RepID=A0A0E9W8J8_ANGAN
MCRRADIMANSHFIFFSTNKSCRERYRIAAIYLQRQMLLSLGFYIQSWHRLWKHCIYTINAMVCNSFSFWHNKCNIKYIKYQHKSEMKK